VLPSPPATLAVHPLRTPSWSSRRSSINAAELSTGLADCSEAAPSTLVSPREALATLPESVATLLTASLASLVIQQEDEESIAYSSKNLNDVFTLGEVLGQGSYGTVRAATHKETGQQYAVKILQKRRNNEDRTEVIESEVSMKLRVLHRREPVQCA
jgi:hypothetical protein